MPVEGNHINPLAEAIQSAPFNPNKPVTAQAWKDYFRNNGWYTERPGIRDHLVRLRDVETRLGEMLSGTPDMVSANQEKALKLQTESRQIRDMLSKRHLMDAADIQAHEPHYAPVPFDAGRHAGEIHPLFEKDWERRLVPHEALHHSGIHALLSSSSSVRRDDLLALAQELPNIVEERWHDESRPHPKADFLYGDTRDREPKLRLPAGTETSEWDGRVRQVDTNPQQVLLNFNRIGEWHKPFISWEYETHFDPNTIAHARMDTRKDSEGRRYLHIDELQSDAHQAAVKSGYLDEERLQKSQLFNLLYHIVREPTYTRDLMTDEGYYGWLAKHPEIWHDGAQPVNLSELSRRYHLAKRLATEPYEQSLARFETLENYFKTDEHDDPIAQKERSGNDLLLRRAPDDMPFKGNWQKNLLRRLIYKAATEGYDGVTWTTGEQQAHRNNKLLSEMAKRLEWEKVEDGNVKLTVYPSESLSAHNAPIVRIVPSADLTKWLGANMAKQVTDTPEKEGAIENPSVDAFGLRVAYDKKVWEDVENILREYGIEPPKRQMLFRQDGKLLPPDISATMREDFENTPNRLMVAQQNMAEIKRQYPEVKKTPQIEQDLLRHKQQLHDEKRELLRRQNLYDAEMKRLRQSATDEEVVQSMERTLSRNIELQQATLLDQQRIVEDLQSRLDAVDSQAAREYRMWEKLARDAKKRQTDNNSPVHHLELTPEMRDIIRQKGFSLFDAPRGGKMKKAVILFRNRLPLFLKSSVRRLMKARR